MEITYKTNHPLNIDDVIEVYKTSTINRPTGDKERIANMYANSNLVVSAWHSNKLVGVSRALTDFVYCCYLSDLAVHGDYQKKGIGKKMVEITKNELGDKVMLLLLAAVPAMDYYPKIGFEKVENGFIIKRKN